MTFNDIVSQVLDLSSQKSGGDYETMVKNAVNRAYRRVLQRVDQDNQYREFSLTSAASTSKYGMPLYVKKVLNIEDATNNKRVELISSSEYDVSYPGTSTSGPPDTCYVLGRYGTQAQPSSAGTIQVVSSNAADDGANFKLRVTGFVSSQLQTEQITLDGTTAATSSNSYDANGLERLVKEAASGSSFTGTLTISDGTTTFATIPPSWTSPTYLWIEFHPIPSSAITYTVRAIMHKPDLINDGDWPELDEDFHNMLIWGASAEVLPVVGKSTMGDKMAQRFENGINEMSDYQQMRPNRVRVFSDVTSSPSLPRRPLIPGVDIGRAS